MPWKVTNREVVVFMVCIVCFIFETDAAPASAWPVPESPPGDADLVAAWSFDDCSGGTVPDDSGNGHDATISGPTWTTNGCSGCAMDFDGSSDYLEVASSPLLESIGDAITIEATIRPQAFPVGSDTMTIVRKQVQSGPGSFILALRHTGGGIPFLGMNLKFAGTLVGLSDTSTPIPPDVCTHVAGTYDGASMRLYVNGEEVASMPQSGTIDAVSTPLVIGRLAHNFSSEYFHGAIDELRIFRTAIGFESVVTCDAGGTYTAECEGDGTMIQLDGTGSEVGVDDELAYWWETDCPGGVFDDPTSPTPVLTVDSGEACSLMCEVTLTLYDGNGGVASCSTTVTVSDTTPPVVTCSVSAVAGGGGDGDHEDDRFLVSYSAADACGAVMTGMAVVETPCCPVPVSDGQVIEFECADHPQCELGLDFEDGVLEVEADTGSLSVTATDLCGHTATCTIDLCVPAGP